MEARAFEYLKHFWKENEVRMFSARETQLYFFLLEDCNRLYWRNPFGCSTLRITNNLGISRQTLCRLRESLQERGLITYQEGKNESAVPGYTLLIKPDERIVQNGTQDGTPNVTQDGTIIKTYKTKDNISIIPKGKLLPLDSLQNILCGDKGWLNHVEEYLGRLGLKMDAANIREKVEEFFLFLQTNGTKSKSVTDAQKHFVNWLLKKENNKGNRQESLSSQRVGVKLTDNSPDKFKNISGW